MSHETFWRIISYFGDVQFWIGLTVATFIIYLLISKKDRHKIAWIILALLPAIVISNQVVYLLKNVFEISRPCFGLIDCPSGYSFPSGHAAVAFAFATMVSLITRKKILSSFMVVLAILVALSRFFLNYHSFIDVTVGGFIGILIAYLLYKVYNPIHSLLIKKKIIP